MKKAIQSSLVSWSLSQFFLLGRRSVAGMLALLLVLSFGMFASNAQAQILHPDWKPGSDDGTNHHNSNYNPSTPISKLSMFMGHYDYAMIGATESKGEDYQSGNCYDLGAQERTLTLPSGATVEKAYLYWSGSWGDSGADEWVKLNGNWVQAERTFTEYVNGGWNLKFYGAFADVTNRVSGSGDYEVSWLDWKKDGDHCNSNSAYGGWSLVVIYEDPSLPESALHVYDGFDGGEWYPSRKYTVKLKDLDFPDDCAIDAELGMLIWEGDSYKSEKLYIDGSYIPGNTLNGSTDPNLDIDIYDISNIVESDDDELRVAFETYVNNGGREWYIHNAFVVKYNKCGADLSCDADNSSFIGYENLTNPGQEPGAGDQVKFSLPINNNGPGAAENVQVRFYFPNGAFNFTTSNSSPTNTSTSTEDGGDVETVTFTIGSLAAGSTETLMFTAQVNPNVGSGTVAAEVLFSPQSDPDSSPNNLSISYDNTSKNIGVIPTEDDECAVPFTQLPVELISFDARLDGNSTVLEWATASETNNAGFEIQHRYMADEAAKSSTFNVLDFVDGHGTTEVEQAYAFRISDLEPGRHVFRLKQIDFDGAFEYSPEIEVEVDMAESFVMESAYPNPFNPEATFRFAVRTQQEVTVELYNMLGQRVQLLYQGSPDPGTMQQVTIDGSSLTSGTYLIRAIGSNFVKTQAVSLVK